LIEQRVPGTRRKEYVLSPAATHLLERCVVGNLRTVGGDIWVDEPRIFVVMPFSERWSSKVYTKMIRPAAKEAGLRCVRGDTSVRVGDLTTSIWSEILKAGAVLADISVANVNVFYELGLVHAIGKDTILIKRKNAPVPADFGGAHYYEYSLDRLKAGKKLIASALKKWSRSRKAAKVKVLK
jgi:hypothetical protein